MAVVQGARVFVLFISFISPAYSAHFEDCGSELGKFSSVTVSGCGESSPVCFLHKGSNATITIQFTPSLDIQTAETVVHGVLGGIPMPFPMPNSDTCHDSGLTCPLKSGESYTYVATLPVKHEYPKVRVDVKWELQTEDEEDIFCVMIPAIIK